MGGWFSLLDYCYEIDFDLDELNSISTRINDKSDINIHYLIFLKRSDYSKKMGLLSDTVYNSIKYYSDNFDGIIHTFPYELLDKYPSKFTIHNMIIRPRTLYVKLPKEDIYVLIGEFNFLYAKSQHEELLDIFALLGATDITYKLSDLNTKNESNNVKIGLNIAQLNMGFDNSKANADNTNYNINGIRKFPNNPTSLKQIQDKLKNDPTLYYHNKGYWNIIINQRCKHGVLSDNYTWTFKFDHTFDNNFYAQLEKLNIQIDRKQSNTNEYTITYNVNYMPLEK